MIGSRKKYEWIRLYTTDHTPKNKRSKYLEEQMGTDRYSKSSTNSELLEEKNKANHFYFTKISTNKSLGKEYINKGNAIETCSRLTTNCFFGL